MFLFAPFVKSETCPPFHGLVTLPDALADRVFSLENDIFISHLFFLLIFPDAKEGEGEHRTTRSSRSKAKDREGRGTGTDLFDGIFFVNSFLMCNILSPHGIIPDGQRSPSSGSMSSGDEDRSPFQSPRRGQGQLSPKSSGLSGIH